MTTAIQAQPVKRNWATRVTKGIIKSPPKILVFGQPGVGKSTLACSAPSPIVIQGEHGTDQINVARFDPPESWADVREQVQTLIDDDAFASQFQSLVLDTLDGLEALLFADICREAGVDSIEKAWRGYGKGYTRAVERWREFLSLLEFLGRKRNMAVVLVAHSMVKNFVNPEGSDYDRWIPRINEKAWGAIYGWVDAALFAHFETANTSVKIDEKGKAVSTGKRMLRTSKAAAVEAKNRYGLPALVELPREGGWQTTIAQYLDAPDRIRAEIEKLLKCADTEGLLKVAPPGLAPKVWGWLATAGADATELQEGLDRLKTVLAAALTTETAASAAA